MSLGNTVTVVKNENLVIVSTPGPKGDKGDTGTNGAGGDVVGPSSSVGGNIPQFSGTTGKILSDSGTSVDYLTNLILAREVTGVAATLVSNHAALRTGIHGINITAGKTLSASNTLTLAGTDGSTLNIGAGGTLAALAFSATAPAGTLTGTTLASGVTASSLTSFGANPVLGNASATSFDVSTGSLSANDPAIDIATTFNNAADTFTALKVNATDTASAFGSMLMDLQVGGSSVFSVSKASRLDCLYGVFGGFLDSPYIRMSSDAGEISLGSSNDVVVKRIAANHLGLSNGSSAQSFSVYNVAGTDYERGVMDWQTTADTLTIGTQLGGAGVARDVRLVRGGTLCMSFPSGSISQFHGDVYTPNVSVTDWVGLARLLFTSSSQISASADGNILLRNNAGTSFDRLQFGGTTASFPSLKRRTTALEARLADDSAITTLVGAMVLKAGAVSDADFTNPVDGCHGFDTTNFKHYVRVGGAWKSSAAYT